MDSGSTVDRTALHYPPLPRALEVVGAPGQTGQGGRPRLSASTPAFRFAARLLPRAGVLRRALLAPSFGDPSGHVLGDPVRPFMRWRRRHFPIAVQTLSVMRAVAERGRTSALPEVPGSSPAPVAPRALASHLTATTYALGEAARSTSPARQMASPVHAGPTGSRTGVAGISTLDIAPPLTSGSTSSGAGTSSSSTARTSTPPAVAPTAVTTAAVPPSTPPTSRSTTVRGRPVRSQSVTATPSVPSTSSVPTSRSAVTARRRASIEERTPTSRQASPPSASAHPEQTAASSVLRDSSSDISREVARAPELAPLRAAEAGATPTTETPSVAEDRPVSRFSPPPIPDAGGVDALEQMRGRLGARPRSWDALDRSVRRFGGRLPAFLRSNITGEDAVARLFSTASLPDVIAPPPGLQIHRPSTEPVARSASEADSRRTDSRHTDGPRPEARDTTPARSADATTSAPAPTVSSEAASPPNPEVSVVRSPGLAAPNAPTVGGTAAPSASSEVPAGDVARSVITRVGSPVSAPVSTSEASAPRPSASSRADGIATGSLGAVAPHSPAGLSSLVSFLNRRASGEGSQAGPVAGLAIGSPGRSRAEPTMNPPAPPNVARREAGETHVDVSHRLVEAPRRMRREEAERASPPVEGSSTPRSNRDVRDLLPRAITASLPVGTATFRRVSQALVVGRSASLTGSPSLVHRSRTSSGVARAVTRAVSVSRPGGPALLPRSTHASHHSPVMRSSRPAAPRPIEVAPSVARRAPIRSSLAPLESRPRLAVAGAVPLTRTASARTLLAGLLTPAERLPLTGGPRIVPASGLPVGRHHRRVEDALVRTAVPTVASVITSDASRSLREGGASQSSSIAERVAPVRHRAVHRPLASVTSAAARPRALASRAAHRPVGFGAAALRLPRHTASAPRSSEARTFEGAATPRVDVGRTVSISASSLPVGRLADDAAAGPATPRSVVAGLPASRAESPGTGTPRISRTSRPAVEGFRVRRSEVGTLPVSGSGAVAAGVASSVAGDVARSAVDAAIAERLERGSGGVASGVGQRVAFEGARGVGTFDGGVRVQRAIGDADADRPSASVESQEDELLKFTMSDQFEERLLEFLEDRLLGEIERRGGRYGGWFA